MPTLLQVHVFANRGSIGRISEQIGEVAMSKGWNSYIAYARDVSPSKSHLIKIGNKADVLLHGLQSRVLDCHGFGSRRATIQFIREIERIKPDIIHLHNIHGYFINVEILFNYLSQAGIHVVWTLHDCWTFTGHCAYFSFVDCNKWKVACNNCEQKDTYPQSLFKDNSQYNFLRKKELFTSVSDITLVPVSRWLGGLLRESFFKNKSVKTIHNGIDLNEFKPQNNTLREDGKFKILGVAQPWLPRKGLRDFFEIATRLDCSKYEITLIGLTGRQIRRLPVGIIGLPATNSIARLAELYSRADVFVNPTYEDNFPTTNIEALACGTPVITYNTGGSPEAIGSDVGIVVKQGDVDELVKTIEQVRVKGKLYYSAKCRQHAVDNFNKDDKFQEYIELYNNILEK